jgi:hypothetical protein
MSDTRFSTDELVEWADNLLGGLGPEMKRLSMNGDNEGFGKAAKDADMLNAIIARLQAADALCVAAKQMEDLHGAAFMRKAIADYEAR